MHSIRYEVKRVEARIWCELKYRIIEEYIDSVVYKYSTHDGAYPPNFYRTTTIYSSSKA